MKRFTFLKLFFTALFAVVFGTMSADVSSTFTDASMAVGTGELPWTSSVEELRFDNPSSSATYEPRGVQFGTNGSPVASFTLTSGQSLTQVTSVAITASAKDAGSTISVTVGGVEFTGDVTEIAKGTNNANQVYTFTGAATDGDIVITISNNTASVYVKSITVACTSTPSIEVAAPKFSVPAGMYSKPIDLTLSAPEAYKIMYTLDGTEPSLDEGNGKIYENPIHISETTTVKAIALDADDNASDVVSATYTIVALDGDGSFENPYTITDLRALGETFTANDVWVKGSIVGVYQNGGDLESPIKTRTNIALGTESDYIPVQLLKGTLLQYILNLVDNPELLNHEVALHGDLESYFTVLGLKSTDKVAGLGEIEVSAAGYSTYFTDMPFEIPAGIEAGIVTGAKNGKLTVDYRYTEGDRVPANTGLLIKAAEGTYPIVVINSNAQTPDDNYLKGSVNGGRTEGEGCLFYMLSYDANGKNLGFYWGANDGGAFESGAGKAYLALPQTVASQVRGFVLDGTTTGISGVTTEANNAPAAVYSLTGVRMGTSTDGLPAGIYIVNGKKVLVK